MFSGLERKRRVSTFFCLFFKRVQKTEMDRYNLVLWVGNEPSRFQHEWIEIISVACEVSALFSQHLLSAKVKLVTKNVTKTSKRNPPTPDLLLYTLTNEVLIPDLFSAVQVLLQVWNRNAEIQLKERSRAVVVNLIWLCSFFSGS